MTDYITLEQLRDFSARADERLDVLEGNISKCLKMTISKDGWITNSDDENFPYQYVLTAEGVTAASRADAVLDRGSIVIASACGVCAACDTADNSVVFKSYKVPTADLTGILYITNEAAMSAT